jgi:hypothetical protein
MWNSSTGRRSLYVSRSFLSSLFLLLLTVLHHSLPSGPRSIVSLPARRRCERSPASASLPSLNSPLDLSASFLGRLSVAVFVVPVPPFVRRSLRVACRRVFPVLLAPERSHIEVAPGAPERLVAAIVDEVVAEHAVAIADERVRAVPLVYAKVFIEVVSDGVPRVCQPIRAFTRSMSTCGAREQNTRVVLRALR